jgi:hypothetical protein
MKFNEDDKKQVIDFLNMVAKHAKFNLDTTEVIQYFRGLQHMQSKIIPKIEANILEVRRIIEKDKAPAEAPPEEVKAKGKK